MGLDIHTYNVLIGPLTPKEFEIKNIIKSANTSTCIRDIQTENPK